MYELLAPAGDLERLKIALLYGADAIYIGGQDFSLRANAKNFSLEEIKKATEYTHSLNKKLYVTINISFHEEDLNNLDEYLIYLNDISVDGIIVSDIVVINRVKKLGLNLFMVLSTQASTYNEYSTKFWQSLGIKRIVLARETNKKEIKRIINNTKVETEVFIHGSMCISFSGKCVLSNITTLRDANRGGCAQVCRWCFKNKNNPDFTMMPKDLNMIENIKEMMSLGVVSYKVEGRMRSVYYIATMISSYRKIFDLVISNKLTKKEEVYYLNILNRCANRESASQFFSKDTDYNDQYFSDRQEVTNKDFLGIVKSYDKHTKIVTLEQRNYLKKGDVVEFFGPNMETFTYEVNTIYNDNLEEIDIARHPKMIVKLKLETEVCENSFMRVKIFDKNDIL